MPFAVTACACAVAALVLATAAGVGAEPSSTRTSVPSAAAVPGSSGCTPRGRGRTERVSVSTEGEQADARILRAAVSANGRFVAFSSAAANLVPGDGNRVPDVFLRDLRTRSTIRISVSSSGAEADEASYFPTISADGRVIAFRSVARNLVEGDRNRVEDVFVHDRLTRQTERVSVGAAGEEANAGSVSSNVSADGSIVAFTSRASNLVRGDRNDLADVFIRDTARRRTIRISVGSNGESDGASEGSGISADGLLVAFRSFGANLVRGDRNGTPDVFVRDWVAGTTERVNVSSSGAEANAVTFRGSVSGDGRWIGFRSQANNLVPGDTNDALDVFERNRVSGKTSRVSVGPEGAQADGRRFRQWERNGSFMSRPFLSAGGRYAAFGSRAPNLVRGDTNGRRDVFVHDRVTKQTSRVSVTSDGAQANGDSYIAGISRDASVIAFVSAATNLVPGDTNGRPDAFVRVRAIARPTKACRWPGSLAR